MAFTQIKMERLIYLCLIHSHGDENVKFARYSTNSLPPISNNYTLNI